MSERSSVNHQFTKDQRAELRELRLRPEQIRGLEDLLPEIAAYLRPRPQTQEVRERLSDLAKAAEQLQRCFKPLSTPKPGSQRLPLGERTRALLDLAQQHLEPHAANPLRWLDDFVRVYPRIEKLVAEALKSDFFQPGEIGGNQGGRKYRHHAHLVRLIVETAGIDGAAVTRDARKPFLRIVEIVSEATGEWSADEAIRAYLKLV